MAGIDDTIIDLGSVRQRQLRAFREAVLHLRMLTDCLADLTDELRHLGEGLEQHSHAPQADATPVVEDLAQRFAVVAARLGETLMSPALRSGFPPTRDN